MRRVAIVGRAQETRDEAPFDDADADIWMMNDYAMRCGRRVTCVFEMHPDWYETDRYDAEYKAWLMSPHPFQILMHERDERVPASVRYPIDTVHSGLWKGGRQVKFFGSTIPYALALAMQRYERIELYGIELRDNGYRQQGDSIFFWLGRAAERGVEIVMPERSGLVKDEIYPFGETGI